MSMHTRKKKLGENIYMNNNNWEYEQQTINIEQESWLQLTWNIENKWQFNDLCETYSKQQSQIS